MDYKNLIAAALRLDIDYEKMSKELLSAMSNSQCVPFSYPASRDDKIEVTAYSLFLRTSSEHEDYSYRGAKNARYDTWAWNTDLDISYTRSIIESIPFKPLATVRVVYFPQVPCVEHTDWDNPDDTEHTLGLSIIPDTADTYCNIWSEKDNSYLAVPGNAMLLNDSIKHSVPRGTRTRITMRIFGEIDYSWFDDKIIAEHCYYR
jgi:hypothetical protein